MDKKKIGIICAVVVVAFLIVGFATNWFQGDTKASPSASNKVDEIIEEVKDKVDEVKTEVENTVEDVKTEVENTVEDVKTEVENTVEDVTEGK